MYVESDIWRTGIEQTCTAFIISLSCSEKKGSQHIQPNIGQAIVSAAAGYDRRRGSKMIPEDSGTVKRLGC